MGGINARAIVRSVQAPGSLGDICFGASTDLVIADFFIFLSPAAKEWFEMEVRHGESIRSARCSSESKVKAGAVEKVALVAIAICVAQALNEYGLETCQVVVQFNWPECQMPVDRQIQSPANEHGKCSCIIYKALGERSVGDRDGGARDLEAARIVGGAKQRFNEWSDASFAQIHTRAKIVSKQCLVYVEITDVSVVHGVEAANRGQPSVEVEGHFAKPAVGGKRGNVDAGVYTRERIS